MHNPLLKLIFCLSLIISISVGHLANVFFLAVMVSFALFNNQVGIIVKACLRVRWIILVLVLITTFNEPGKIISIFAFGLAPTYEGLYSALYHAIRFIDLMMVVSLMTNNIKRDDLISAIYQLLTPLKILKCDIERFSARLCLTLEYVQAPLTIKETLLRINSFTYADRPMNTVIQLSFFELKFLELLWVFMVSLLPFLVLYLQP